MVGPLQLAARGADVFVGAQRGYSELGVVHGLRFDDGEARLLTIHDRADFTLIAGGGPLGYVAAAASRSR